MYSTNPIVITIGLILALSSVRLSSTARAVSPPPDGGYSGFNTAEGEDALFSLTSGASNTAVGALSLYNNTTGSFNTASGGGALADNTTGNGNTATGLSALSDNTTGGSNTASGFAALQFNSSGGYNTANGALAVLSNKTGSNNTGSGAQALYSNTTGSFNTADGVDALYSNTGGGYNMASGVNALFSNTTGNNNTASGVFALQHNTTGSGNLADGYNALISNTTGGNNTANGRGALFHNTTASNNTACGYQALLNNTTGNNNIALGISAGSNLTTGNNNIDIGGYGVAGESNTIRIGKAGTQNAAFITGIRGTTVPGGVTVMIDATGRLGTLTSSQRYKEATKPMAKESEVILDLQPVTFRYKHELDPTGIPQFGLVAEQVEKVSPDLVARDEEGKAYTVRYEVVNAMLLNEFLKEHRKVEEQEATIKELKSMVMQQRKDFQALSASLKEQALQLQKVSDQLVVNKTSPRTLADNQ